MNKFSGKVLFLDKNDINTDEIIPAKYLTELSKEALKPFALEDLKLDGFDLERDMTDKTAIITRSNFGCGSSREHAPWALEANGINLVLAVDFARIFRQNMYNNGNMAVEISEDRIDYLFTKFGKLKDVEIVADLENSTFEVKSGNLSEKFDFSISDFDKDLVAAGGWLEYADAKY